MSIHRCNSQMRTRLYSVCVRVFDSQHEWVESVCCGGATIFADFLALLRIVGSYISSTSGSKQNKTKAEITPPSKKEYKYLVSHLKDWGIAINTRPESERNHVTSVIFASLDVLDDCAFRQRSGCTLGHEPADTGRGSFGWVGRCVLPRSQLGGWVVGRKQKCRFRLLRALSDMTLRACGRVLACVWVWQMSFSPQTAALYWLPWMLSSPTLLYNILADCTPETRDSLLSLICTLHTWARDIEMTLITPVVVLRMLTRK